MVTNELFSSHERGKVREVTDLGVYMREVDA